ncbi:MAG: aminotransferase class IV [Actinobacteria bacterium]|nr:aminotransferase class IV [Actinomycetota bacterium]
MTIFPDGRGLFETLKTINGCPQFLNLHFQRVFNGARVLNIGIPNVAQLKKSLLEFIEMNQVQTSAGRLRIEFYDDGTINLSHSPYEPWTSPAALTTTGLRVNEKSTISGVKSLPYRENMELIKRANESGFDEVIRFNTRNHVCEGATSNLLLKIHGKWVTPNLASGCLPGITRALCLRWFEIQERSIHRDELADVESVFILSSLRGLQPAISIGPHELVIDSVMTTQGQARMQAHSID